ncbi:MAG: hypothetical protein KIT73_13760 [Burkholderiales bacterium]|nr:hypothetical protein [Burkholderiales bacterium]
MILTIRPASATGALSNGCLQRDAAKPVPSKLMRDSADEWMRWRAPIVKLTVPVNGKSTKLSGNFIKGFQGNCYYELDKNSPDSVTPKTCSYVPGGPGVSESPSYYRYVLVKINSTGTPCAYFWESAPSSQKCTNSCWTSLRPR